MKVVTLIILLAGGILSAGLGGCTNSRISDELPPSYATLDPSPSVTPFVGKEKGNWRAGEFESVRVGLDTREKVLQLFGDPIWTGKGPDETGRSETDKEIWDQFEDIDPMYSRLTFISSADTGVVSLIEAQVPSLPLAEVFRRFGENYQRKEYIDVVCSESDSESTSITVEGNGPYSSVYYIYPDLGIAVVTQADEQVISVEYRSEPPYPTNAKCRDEKI